MIRRRIRSLLLVLGLVVLAAAGGWALGSRIQSPAEAAARTAPPQASPILVPVEQRVIETNIIARGTARYGQPVSISLVPSTLKLAPAILTGVPEIDARLTEGSLLLTVSGRPVFVLQGALPVYRDMGPGLSGEDVRQLETALQRMGMDPGEVDGRFDQNTSAAVAAFYRAAGFEPFGPTPAQKQQIRDLEAALAMATSQKSAAEDAAARAPLGVEAARARAELNLLTASAPERAVVQIEGEILVREAMDAQCAAEREAGRLNELVLQITADLTAAQDRAGVQVPSDEIVFLADLPARVDSLSLLIGQPIAGGVLIVTNTQLVIDSSLPLDEALLVKPGMPVFIDEPDLAIEASGSVSRVAQVPGTDGADGFHIYFETLVDAAPTALDGVSLRLTIPTSSTGEAVTAVPVSAITLGADGSSRVQVEREGSLAFVEVEPGLSADGFVAVTPIGASLQPGQLVVVGFEQ